LANNFARIYTFNCLRTTIVAVTSTLNGSRPIESHVFLGSLTDGALH